MTGFTSTSVSDRPHQVRTALGGDKADPAGVLDPSDAARANEGGLGEVDVDHDLLAGRAASTSCRRLSALLGCSVLRRQVERELTAGQLADHDGAPYVERIGRSQRN